MKPVQIPNIPDGDVRCMIVDGRAPDEIKENLKKQGISVISTSAHPDVYSSIAHHPDIMLHHIGEDMIVYAPNTPVKLVSDLYDTGFRMIEGKTMLSAKYPGTIAYNVARVGNYAFHNTRHTDPVVRDLLMQRGVEILHVNQGYSKCLITVVDKNSIITSDSEIYKKAVSAGMDALLVSPDRSVILEPFDMGFIGGATGLIGKNRLAFTGNLNFHKNFKEIIEFLSLKAVHMVMLNDEKLLDLGSLIPVLQD